MPIYEYQCPDCGHRFELIQKFSDAPATVCPQCGKDQVKKLVSASSFILKGSGWYRDHYGIKSSGAGDSGGGSEGGGSSEGAGASSSAPAAPASSTPAPAAASAPAAPAASAPSSSSATPK